MNLMLLYIKMTRFSDWATFKSNQPQNQPLDLIVSKYVCFIITQYCNYLCNKDTLK